MTVLGGDKRLAGFSACCTTAVAARRASALGNLVAAAAIMRAARFRQSGGSNGVMAKAIRLGSSTRGTRPCYLMAAHEMMN